MLDYRSLGQLSYVHSEEAERSMLVFTGNQTPAVCSSFIQFRTIVHRMVLPRVQSSLHHPSQACPGPNIVYIPLSSLPRVHPNLHDPSQTCLESNLVYITHQTCPESNLIWAIPLRHAQRLVSSVILIFQD